MAQYNSDSFAIITSPERKRFVELRRRYDELGEEHQQQFSKKYDSYSNADDLFTQMPIVLEKVFTETTAMVARDLAANGIYDISEQTIRADLEARSEAFADDFNRVQKRYFDIIGQAAELEAQRQDAQENREKIVGGGFGAEGAAGGIAIAAAANAAIGFTYGLVNLAKRATSEHGTDIKKRQLLWDKTTKASLSKFLSSIALEGAELVASKVNDGKSFEAVDSMARQKAAAMVENVAADRVPETHVRTVLGQALALNPFNSQTWIEWLNRFGDADGSVAACADNFGVRKALAHKTILLSKRKAELSWNTPEECRANSAILEKYAIWLGLPFDSERDRIDANAKRLELHQRSFNGIEYGSFEEATEARCAHEDKLQRTVEDVVYDTHQAANDARTLLREQYIATTSANTPIGWLTLPYRRYRDTMGRSSRKEFWTHLTALACKILLLPFIVLINEYIFPSPISTTLNVLLAVLLLISLSIGILVQIRRFHDLDMSGWFVLLNLIPYIGWAIVLGFMLRDGTPSDNRFGYNPKRT